MRTCAILFRLSFAAAVTIFFASPARAAAPAAAVSGYVALDEGQIVKGISEQSGYSAIYKNVWQQRLLGAADLDISIGERLRAYLGIEGGLMSFSLRQYNDVAASLLPLWDLYPTRAEARYTFGDTARPWLQLGFGLFPVKYNPDARNLGEYLLRSAAYPNFLTTDFEFPMTRLVGIRAGSTLWNSLHQDLLLTMETNYWPVGDLSLSYLAGYSIGRFADIGAGVSFQHLISVWDSQEVNGQKRMYTTPKNNPDDMFVDADGDTGYYTYRGTRLMGRVALDPKTFIPAMIFGENDLRVYAEIAVLGVKNYASYVIVGDTVRDSLGFPITTPLGTDSIVNPRLAKGFSYYDSILQRMPIMFGINIPTFKMLDVCAVEFEWSGNRFPNSYRRAGDMDNQGLVPLPVRPAVGTAGATWEQWKWSLYVKRTFAKRFSISAQAARDHMKPATHHPGNRQDRGDFLIKKDHWWWMARVRVDF
jgi:hypothetical protein